MEQKIITSKENYRELEEWMIAAAREGGVLVVHDDSLRFMPVFSGRLNEIATRNHISLTFFSDFQPNPLYESAVRGVGVFRREKCRAIMAVGGGSAMDVAKCVKLYSDLPGDGAGGAWLKAESVPNRIPFLVMPTTAGTGSEATRYAVLYYNDAKQSITSESFIPETVMMDPGALKTLPPYQKKATMCDALCHAIESFWSVNSTEESKRFSRAAIEGVLENMGGYLANTEEGNAGMLFAAHMAGQAINVTQTTAGHAMCYKITSLFRAAHGHAAILCDRVLYPWMVENVGRCSDPRGKEYLRGTLDEIGRAMGCANAEEGAEKLNAVFEYLALEVPSATDEQFGVLKNSVNPVRLKNHPIALDTDTIAVLYHRILNEVEA
jgi:alcohol dehydrogenase class IV